MRGPNIDDFEKKFYKQGELGGRGPNTENFKKKFYKQCKLGLADEINFAKISFLFHSQEPLHNKSIVILYYFSRTPSS
ncbi:hypothetical protein SAB0771 [Staphylococcus aureus RF122]|nr:hypothetical protein SAB0771 [Staphylococcus aureus RF122]